LALRETLRLKAHHLVQERVLAVGVVVGGDDFAFRLGVAVSWSGAVDVAMLPQPLHPLRPTQASASLDELKEAAADLGFVVVVGAFGHINRKATVCPEPKFGLGR
jgi:hypothetical protein